MCCSLRCSLKELKLFGRPACALWTFAILKSSPERRGGTPSEYYLCLIESNTFESAPEMSCALFKKGRVFLPSLGLTLHAYQIIIFFFPGMAGSCLK